MKRKMIAVMSVIMLIFISITGCTAKSAVKESDTKTAESILNESALNDETIAQSEDGGQTKTRRVLCSC